jgi:hypothetical protein
MEISQKREDFSKEMQEKKREERIVWNSPSI